MKYSFKRTIKIYKTNLKRWLNKSNSSKVSLYEDEIIKMFRRLIYNKTSKCFVDIKLNKRYIENPDKDILIILESNQVTIINGKRYDIQRLCIHNYDLLCDIFDTRLSFIRIKKELEYLENTTNFLENINLKLK